MKSKIKLITDFDTRILSNYLESGLNMHKNYIIFKEQVDNLNFLKTSSNYDYVIYLTQLDKTFLQYKLFCDTGDYNQRELMKEIENLSKIVKNFSLQNKKVLFFLWPIDVNDNYFGEINHKDTGKSWLINFINLYTSKLLSKYNNVMTINPNFEVLKHNKRIDFYDYKLKYLINCYYNHDYLNFVSKITRQKINNEKIQKIKLIILDLDNTLWGGIAGEMKYDQVKIGPNSLEGQVYLDFQKRLKLLKSMGILLAIASKNDFKNVKKIFQRNSHMFLSLKDFSSIKVNWDPKPKNIEMILNDLNLKSHHALFIDDSAFERSSVKTHIKKINIFNFPSNILDLMDYFNNYKGFDKIFVSQVDKKRTSLYQAENRRIINKRKFKNDSRWLKSLNITLTIKKLKDLERANEMFQRTNQFNTSFRRLSISEILKIRKLNSNSIFEVSMKDKFGDYGVISIINVKNLKNHFEIEDFLLSCRVFKREIEFAILNYVSKLKIFKSKKGFIKISRNERNQYVQKIFDNNIYLKKIATKKYEINKKMSSINLKKLGINIIK